MASNSRGNNLSAKVAVLAEEFLERRQPSNLMLDATGTVWVTDFDTGKNQ
jgi:hypothetical protein